MFVVSNRLLVRRTRNTYRDACVPPGLLFLAGLGSGVTEAVIVVTPAEVCKIRMQAQYHSLLDPEQVARRKYRHVLQTAAVVVREEGVRALYKGLVPTTLRQGCNQVTRTREHRKRI